MRTAGGANLMDWAAGWSILQGADVLGVKECASVVQADVCGSVMLRLPVGYPCRFPGLQVSAMLSTCVIGQLVPLC